MKQTALYLVLLALLVVAGIAGYAFYKAHPSAFVIPSFSFSAPCSSPIPYTIGSVDPRFGLSNSQIISDLAEAVSLWNNAAGRKLLEYEPNNPNAMPVNFVYDT